MVIETVVAPATRPYGISLGRAARQVGYRRASWATHLPLRAEAFRWTELRSIGAALCLGVAMPGLTSASWATDIRPSARLAPMTLADEATRTQVLSAIQSPDGQYIGYIYATPNLEVDGFDIAISVQSALSGGKAFSLSRYHIRTKDAFDPNGGHPDDSIGQLRWSPDSRHLLYTDHIGQKMRLNIWDIQKARSTVIGDVHTKILISVVDDRHIKVDASDWKRITSPNPLDRARIIEADQEFLGYDPDHNDDFAAAASSFLFSWQSFALSAAPQRGLAANPDPNPKRNFVRVRSGNEIVETLPGTADPSGRFIAFVQTGFRNVDSATFGEEFERILIKTADGKNIVAKVDSGGDVQSIWGIGWNESGTEFYLQEHCRWSSKIVALAPSGVTRTVFEEEWIDLDEPELDFKAADYFHTTRSLGYNPKVNRVLLVRSKGTVPGELVSIDLNTGNATSIFSPNAKLAGRLRGTRSKVALSDDHLFGVLYTPDSAFKPPYPLVVTSYRFAKGFPSSTTDEVPISLLVNSGIAVFSLNVGDTLTVSEGGNFSWEVSHYARPLRAMEQEIAHLADSGVVDASKVGLSGGSFGQELGMYAYFRSKSFRTMSLMGGGWSPMSYLTVGLQFQPQLKGRGYLGLDFSDPKVFAQWKEVSAAFNGRPDRPPLLWQSGDAERYFSLETWYHLKDAGAQIEWLEYPEEGHSKASPSDKWWVYSRNLDWFRFWLQNYEDRDPSKTEQYRRWRDMRDAWQRATAQAARGN